MRVEMHVRTATTTYPHVRVYFLRHLSNSTFLKLEKIMYEQTEENCEHKIESARSH